MLYTLGQVSEITGINKRTLKYYVERKIIVPHEKRYEGGKVYWMYSESDILRIRQVALYKDLGYSAQQIKDLISSPNFNWRKELDNQIDELKRKKRHFENLIFAAELMRYSNDLEENMTEFDITDFDNDIDQFAVNVFNTDEEDVMAEGIEKFNADITEGLSIEDINKQGQVILDMISQLRNSMHEAPESSIVQNNISEISKSMESLFNEANMEPKDVLFGLRLVSNLSFDRISDIIFSKEGSLEFLSKAIQIYIEHRR